MTVRILRAPVQCVAHTKSGKRCGITADCTMKDKAGTLVCEPLCRGSKRCTFHLEIFARAPVIVEDPIVFYLDFETTGLSVTRDHIVEIGVLEHTTQAIYSTVVCPPSFPTSTEPPVHGISDEELKQGPEFRVAFARMAAFLENCANMAVRDLVDSSDEEFGLPILKESPPSIVIVAHNGLLGRMFLFSSLLLCYCC